MTQEVNAYLGTEKIGKLMRKFAIPAILTMLVNSLYNIVDQVFIGRGVGFLGNGATNIVFPATVIGAALCLMIGDGTAAFLSICQGKRDTESAHRGVGNAIVFVVAAGVILATVLLLFKERVLHLFGATEANISYARDYYSIIVPGLPFLMLGMSMNGVIRADGSPKIAMATVLSGCILNMILDPIAIFVLGWGIRGAALATVTGQVVSAALCIFWLPRLKSVHLCRDSFKIHGRILGQQLSLGVSSFLTQLSMVIIMVVINNVLVHYGGASKYGEDIPLTVVGIISKCNSIIIAIAVGTGVGSQPLVGYNYGARKYDRVKKIYLTMLKCEIVLGAIATLVFELFPVQIISIFGNNGELYNEFARISVRVYMSTCILSCIIKASAVFLQAVGRPMHATSLSMMRDFILSIPLQLTLPLAFGVVGVMYAVPIIDVVTVLLAAFFIRRLFKQMDDPNFVGAANIGSKS